MGAGQGVYLWVFLVWGGRDQYFGDSGALGGRGWFQPNETSGKREILEPNFFHRGHRDVLIDGVIRRQSKTLIIYTGAFNLSISDVNPLIQL